MQNDIICLKSASYAAAQNDKYVSLLFQSFQNTLIEMTSVIVQQPAGGLAGNGRLGLGSRESLLAGFNAAVNGRAELVVPRIV